MTQMNLQIEGMSCGGCVRRVDHGLRNLPGVHVDKVDIGAATLHFDPDKTTTTRICQALSELGFTATILPTHN